MILKELEICTLDVSRTLLLQTFFLGEYATRAGFTPDVTYYENATILFDALYSKEVDAIASNIMLGNDTTKMPVMNGLDATVAIRTLDRDDAKTVPIIAMTANAFEEDVQHSHDAGMNAHLAKPIVPDDLYHTLEQQIGGK